MKKFNVFVTGSLIRLCSCLCPGEENIKSKSKPTTGHGNNHSFSSSAELYFLWLHHTMISNTLLL